MKINNAAKVTCAFETARSFTTANGDFEHFKNPSTKKAMREAFYRSADDNQWTSMALRLADWSYSVGVYRGNTPDRMITLWRDPADNEGFKFSVHRWKRSIPFRTNNLEHALGNFKTPDPVLTLVPPAARPQ